MQIRGSEPLLTITQRWLGHYPDAHIGILEIHNVANPTACSPLDAQKAVVEELLRQRYSAGGTTEIRALPVMQAYKTYYKQFKKSYHVQQQVESIVLKGRAIPNGAALVEAMFMAELNNMLLTAGHDLDVLHSPIKIDVAEGSEVYTRMNGQEQILKAGDMYIADCRGVMSAIIYGPDQRTQITPATRNVLYTVYAPSGISAGDVLTHLLDLKFNVELIAPEAETTELNIYPPVN